MWQRLLWWMVVLVWGHTAHGQTVFREVFGDSACYDEGYSIVPTGNNYLVSTAYLCNAGWQSRMLLLDLNGDSVNTFDAIPYNGYVHPTTDNNFIFLGGNKAGLAYDSILIAKVNPQLDTLWTRWLYFAECNNQVYSMTEVADGYIVTGIYSEIVCNNGPSFQSFAVKVDNDGNELWRQIYGAPDNDDELFTVKEYTNGQLWFYGWRRDTNGTEPWLLLTNSNGDSLTSYFADDLGDGSGYGFDLTRDGGFITISYSDSIYARKFDSNVTMEWERSLGIQSGGVYFRAFETLDRSFGFLACLDGLTGCNSNLFKLNTDGEIMWAKNWNGLLRNVTEHEPGQFLLTGYTNAFPVLPEALVVRFDTIFDSIPNSVLEHDLGIGLSIYPNPTSEKINIECSDFITGIELFAINGNRVQTSAIEPNKQAMVDLGTLPNGLYIVKVATISGQMLFSRLNLIH